MIARSLFNVCRLFEESGVQITSFSVSIHHGGGATVLFLKSRGDHVLLGDLIKSISVYVYKEADHSFELVRVIDVLYQFIESAFAGFQ